MSTSPASKVNLSFKRRGADSLKDVFKRYEETVGLIAEASVLMKKVADSVVLLERSIRSGDSIGDLSLVMKLRIKMIAGVVFPTCQHLDRLLVRMRACASQQDDILAEAERSPSTFE